MNIFYNQTRINQKKIDILILYIQIASKNSLFLLQDTIYFHLSLQININSSETILKMDDLQNGLLVGKGKKQSKQYKRRFDQCEQKLKLLRNKNNQLQKNMNLEMESDVRHAVKQQGQLLEKDIKELKNLITKLSKDYTDQMSKNKIKDLWKMVGTEVERNKRIIEQFATRASTASFMKRSGVRNTNNKNNINNLNKAVKRQYSNQDLIQKQGGQLQSDQMDHQEIQLQQRIMAQKAAILKQIQEKNNQINLLYNDMAEMVGGQQRDMVNQIDKNIVTAQQNLIQANVQLDQAQVQQKKSKKKYTCITTCIIVCLLILAGLIYFFFR